MGKPNFNEIDGEELDDDSEPGDKPSFEAISGDSTESKGGSSDGSRPSYDEQIIIKGKWGSIVKRRDGCCSSCGSKATHVVVGREEKDGDHGFLRGVRNSCKGHKDDIAHDLEDEADVVIFRSYKSN